jgi:hypothetical protein
VLFCSKFNWVHRYTLKKIFGRHPTIGDSCNLLQKLSDVSKSNKIVSVKKRKFQKVKIKTVNEHFTIRAINIVKQSMKLRFFISQGMVLHKLKQWGMIDKKRDKPIACNYMNGKFAACFKIKNVL